VKHIFPVRELHEFRDADFIGGHPAPDFVNTVTGRNGAPRDWLAGPAALADWGEKAGLLTSRESRDFLALCSADPAMAQAAFERAIGLREAIYALLDSVVRGIAPPAESLAKIESAWRSAAQESELVWTSDEGLAPEVAPGLPDIVRDRVALSFVDLGRELTSGRLRRCAGGNCAWFFFDTSKAGRRRWCDMAVCGNTAKYARARKAKRPGRDPR
jgi:predicted RNA-binding Zn ribbon-like protein